jgi:hypothetical protein
LLNIEFLIYNFILNLIKIVVYVKAVLLQTIKLIDKL